MDTSIASLDDSIVSEGLDMTETHRHRKVISFTEINRVFLKGLIDDHNETKWNRLGCVSLFLSASKTSPSRWTWSSALTSQQLTDEQIFDALTMFSAIGDFSVLVTSLFVTQWRDRAITAAQKRIQSTSHRCRSFHERWNRPIRIFDERKSRHRTEKEKTPRGSDFWTISTECCIQLRMH